MRIFAPFVLTFLCFFAQAVPNYDYGPGRTVRWADGGSHQAPKVTDKTVSIQVNDQFVNELVLRANKSDVEVKEVRIYLLLL